MKMIKPVIKVLYKYREFSTNTLEALVSNLVWVDDVRNFNDPLETHYRIVDDLNLSKYDIRHKSAKDIYQKTTDLLRRKGLPMGIYCLSERNDIGLMWTHYSAGHSGFCIGYERTKANILGNSAVCVPVKYEKSPPSLRYSDMQAVSQGNQKATEDFGYDLIYNKDFNFHYEKEWRLCFKRRRSLEKLDAKICSITFGYKMSESRRKLIMRLLSDKTDITYYEAIPNMDSYNMTIVTKT